MVSLLAKNAYPKMAVSVRHSAMIMAMILRRVFCAFVFIFFRVSRGSLRFPDDKDLVISSPWEDGFLLLRPWL